MKNFTEVVINKFTYEDDYIKIDYTINSNEYDYQTANMYLHLMYYLNGANLSSYKDIKDEIKKDIKELLSYIKDFKVINFKNNVEQLAVAVSHWIETQRHLNSYMITALMPREIHKNHGEEIKIII